MAEDAYLTKANIFGSCFVWEKYGVLPYVDGQKYTFGDNLTTNHDEGHEYILWTQSSQVVDNVCEITCEKNKYWIVPLQDSAIFVNQKKIINKTQLKFGDNFSLLTKEGQLNSGGQTKEDSPCHFKFEKRDLDKHPQFEIWRRRNVKKMAAEPGSETFESLIGQNAVVLSNIMSYLTVYDLKSARLVSKSWNSTASPHLKKKSYLKKLTFYHYDTKQMSATTKIHLLSQDLKTFSISNWKMSIPPAAYIFKTIPDNLVSKLSLDLDGLFGLKGHMLAIKNLSLAGVIRKQSDWDLQMKLLQTVAGTVQQLTWDGYWMIGADFVFPTCIEFKKLDNLSFRAATSNQHVDQANISTMCGQILKAVQGVRSIHLGITSGYGFRDGIKMTKYNYTTILHQLHTLQNLDSISLELVDPDMLNYLLAKMNKPLKKLSIKTKGNFAPEDLHLLEELLRNNCGTLESLSITLAAVKGQTKKPFPVQFPSFPALKIIKLLWARDREEDGDVMSIAFPGGICIYEEHLPTLQALTLAPIPTLMSSAPADIARDWSKFHYIYNIFFPKKSVQICKTLQVLDVHWIGRNGKVFKRAAQLVQMFPSVANAWTMMTGGEFIKEAVNYYR